MVAIGPIPMMKACSEVTRPFGVPTVVSLNSIMVDGTGMCGSCRVTVGGKMKFACVDGADFDGHLVNFDELSLRQKRFAREEKAAMERYRSESAKLASFRRPSSRAPNGSSLACEMPDAEPEPPGAAHSRRTSGRFRRSARPCPISRPRSASTISRKSRSGWIWKARLHEAERCLRCKKPRCVPGCPVGIDIPGFIAALQQRISSSLTGS